MDLQLKKIVTKIGGLTDKEREYLLRVLSGLGSTPAAPISAVPQNTYVYETKITQNISDEMLRAKVLDIVGSIPRLSSISYNAGDLIAGRFIAPSPTATSTEPTNSGFTGSFVSGIGETFGGDTYNTGGVSAGALQWGAKQTDGKLYAGAGAVTLDEDGVTINDAGDSITFFNAGNDTYSTLSQKFGSTSTSLRLMNVKVSSTTNLLTNGNFETGDLTGWTETDPGGTISVVTGGYNGGYAALLNAGGVVDSIAQNVTSSAGGVLISLRLKTAVAPSPNPEIYINGATYGQVLTGGDWRTAYYYVSGTVTSVSISMDHNACYIDDVVVLPVSKPGDLAAATILELGPGTVYLKAPQGFVEDIDGTDIIYWATKGTTPQIWLNAAQGDVDTFISGDTDPYLLYCDAGNGRVGIGKNNPAYKLDVTGDINFTGDLYDNGVLFSSGGVGNGWTAGTGTWSYSSADDPTFVISINADVTALIQPGDRIKLTQTTAKYFIVTAVGSFSGGATLVTVYGGTDYDLANAAISSPYYSHVKNPFGFPADPDKWTYTLTDTSDRTQASPTQNTVYNLGSLSIAIPIGVWRVQFNVQAWANSTAGQTSSGLHAGLHTANNALPSSALLRGFAAQQGASGSLSAGASISVSTSLNLASKTTYYCNAYTPFTGQAAIYFYNSTLAPLTVKCVCAYL